MFVFGARPDIAAAFPLESQLSLFSFLVGGICDRHPALRVVVLESGAGWLPFWLWWLDELYERVARRAVTAKDGEWVVGSGYDQTKTGGHPHRDALRAAVPDLPRRTSGMRRAAARGTPGPAGRHRGPG